MPQEHTPAEIKAEASSEETKQFVRRVRRVTRCKFTPEEKVRVVLEGFRGEVKESELCRREGIRPNVYYAWLSVSLHAPGTRLSVPMDGAGRAELESRRQGEDRAGHS